MAMNRLASRLGTSGPHVCTSRGFWSTCLWCRLFLMVGVVSRTLERHRGDLAWSSLTNTAAEAQNLQGWVLKDILAGIARRESVMEVPEFDLFARIENLERAVGEAPLSAGDASHLAMHAFELSFAARAIHYPFDARRSKDSQLRKLRDVDFNERWLDLLAADLLKICEALEKQLSRHVRMNGELRPSVRKPGDALEA